MKKITKIKTNYTEKLTASLSFEMIMVKGGSFLMGKDEENPGHQITVPDFYMGKYPVTVEEYLHFAKTSNSNYPEWLEEGNQYNIYTGTSNYYKNLGAAITHPRHPIVGISWHNAHAYCEWLSKKTDKKYTLPSEAQWEYAARGGNQSLGFPYAGSYKLKEVGWYYTNSHGETKPVGLKLPNELGIHDMSGNIREWCLDHWQEDVDKVPKDGSAWLDPEKANDAAATRVVRGGSWSYDGNCRVSIRNGDDADLRYSLIGFRVLRY